MAIQSITGNASNSVAPTKSASKSSAIEPQNQAPGSISNTDTVSLTHNIKNGSDAASASIVDEKRVAHIKTALQSGSYEINPERVAQKLIDFEQRIFSNTT